MYFTLYFVHILFVNAKDLVEKVFQNIIINFVVKISSSFLESIFQQLSWINQHWHTIPFFLDKNNLLETKTSQNDVCNLVA